MRFLLIIVLCCLPLNSYAQSFSLIRDAETESVVKRMAEPIFDAAGVQGESIRIYIVNDNSLNAFVAGGQNIFIHTGLITWSKDPSVVAGVIAHEAGHIKGGHLVRQTQLVEDLTVGTIIGTLLGAATIAAGAGEVGQAILTGSGQLAGRQFLSSSRAHEQSADQVAVEATKKAGYSLAGLVELMKELGRRQRQLYGDVDPYLQTHPLSQRRISFIEQHVDPDKPSAPEDMQRDYARVVAKVAAFLEEPTEVAARYPSSDTSLPARYARAVLLHREARVQEALKSTKELTQDYPQDGYIHELYGQIAYENGRVDEAIMAYHMAADLEPNQPLIQLGLATALVGRGNEEDHREAISYLQLVLVKEPRNSAAWRQLGLAKGRLGEMAESYMAFAEAAAIRGKREEAYQFIKRAKQQADEHNPDINRQAEDIINSLKKQNGA